MKFFIETIGCQMNVNDSEEISTYLLECGWTGCDNIFDADMVILNTCAVRFSAEHKAYSFLGRLKEQKDVKPKLIIGVAGCMAQYAEKEIKKRCKYVDFVIGAKSIDNFKDIIKKYACGQINSCIKPANNNISRFITIMRGCSNFCSYCIVPYVRGPEISISDDTIYKSVENAVNEEAREITLLGQNVNSYNYNNINFANLLKKISKIDGLRRIRFMTNHPKDLSDELIEEIANNNKICKHIHLPVQSGSDKILKLMNRKYTVSQYVELYNKIKSRIPDINITSDIIIGFPGETDIDFNETFKISEKLKFGGLFIFKYSPRPKTISYKLKDDVSEEIKRERLNLLLERSNEISKENNNSYVNNFTYVLVESFKNNVCEGRNSQNLKVFFETDKDLTGQIVKIKITKALANSLTGQLKNENI